jgi:phage terminase large subunit
MNFCKYECAEFNEDGKFVRYNWANVSILLDPSALSFRTALRKKGFRVKKAKNSVLNGIRVMANLLNNGDMKYSDVCIETFKEFGSYVWDAKAGEKGEDKPVKMFDHTMDADRYFAYTILRGRLGMEVWK